MNLSFPKLISGARDGLVRHGVEDDNITFAWVPGAFEIPVIAKKMAYSQENMMPLYVLVLL